MGWQGKQEQEEERGFKAKVRGKGLAVMIKTTMTPSNSSALVQTQRRRIGSFVDEQRGDWAKGRRPRWRRSWPKSWG